MAEEFNDPPSSEAGKNLLQTLSLSHPRVPLYLLYIFPHLEFPYEVRRERTWLPVSACGHVGCGVRQPS